MHELYIAECILKSVRDSLPPQVACSAVDEVRVDVGRLDAVVPETLQFLFDAIKAGQDMPHAELKLTVIPVNCRCRECSLEFRITEPLFICTGCGSGKIDVLSGRGIRLTGITARDTEGVACGNTGCP